MQLAIVREENKKLLDTILDFTKPKVEEVPVREVPSYEPKVKSIKHQLKLAEEEDRLRAKIYAEIDQREQELGIGPYSKPNASSKTEPGNDSVSDSKAS